MGTQNEGVTAPAPSAPTTVACRNHPARDAIGICVECRARVCGECVTKVDGINYCVRCYGALAEKGAAQSREDTAATPIWRARLAAGALLLLLSALTWGLFEVALPGSG